MLRKQESITQLHGLYKIDRTRTFVTSVCFHMNKLHLNSIELRNTVVATNIWEAAQGLN